MEIFQILEFSQEWIDLGIITPDKLKQLETLWATGEDMNTEHYRWGAFLDFIKSEALLDEEMANALYELGGNDPDAATGGAMMAHILRHKNCPKRLLQRGVKSEKRFLQKIANEQLTTLN
jgi:hypothetical protein